MTPQEKIAELERQLAEAKKDAMGMSKMPEEVTALITTRTGLTWPHDLPQVFYRLQRGAQSVPLRVFVGCQQVVPEKIDDGTAVWLEDRAGKLHLPPANYFPQFKLFKVRHMADNIGQNLCAQYKVLVENVETKYCLFVEDDTLAPLAPGMVRILLEALQADPKLAMVGYLYEWATDHPNMGCTLARADVMKEIAVDPGFKFKGNCVCRWLYEEEFPRRGLKAQNVWDAYGFHLKSEK